MSALAWRNWAGTQRCEPQQILRPRSIDEVRRGVSACNTGGLTLRVSGSGHSFSPLVPGADVIMDVDGIAGVDAVDAAGGRASVRAGTTIAALGPLLWEAGVGLPNQGGIDAQTLAGAISTGTHGSGLRFPSLSGTLRGAEIVAATGESISIDEGDPRLPAVMTSLGLLGVLVRLDIAVVPAYYLAKTLSYRPLAEVREEWHECAVRHRHYSFWWGPAFDTGDIASPPPGMSGPCLVRVYDEVDGGADPRDVGADCVDRAYRIYPDRFEKPWDEVEYFVAYDDALDALDAIAPVLRKHPDDFPAEVRTVGSESGLLSPAVARDTVSIGLCRSLGVDNDYFFHEVDCALKDFNARPHWGKRHRLTPARLRRLYPGYDEFVSLRRGLDPTGMFLNDHLRELFA
jgi:FAD/FMN-containing dehydrogenase